MISYFNKNLFFCSAWHRELLYPRFCRANGGFFISNTMMKNARKCFWYFFCTTLLTLVSTTTWASSLSPKSLLIYYSWPSEINGTYSVDGAAAEMGQYDYVVLGDGLEKTSHSDHDNTAKIIAHADMAATMVFGYIDLGVSTQNLDISEIKTSVDEWAMMGVTGIFFDDFGYDYGTTRERQNEAVEYVHDIGLSVIANAWKPDDVFNSTVVAKSNPTGLATQLASNDFYLFESLQISEGAYVSETTWQSKADTLKTYQDTLGFKILAVTTNDSANAYDQDKFYYAWYAGLMYGYEAIGWGEYWFSALDANAVYREPPSVDAGTVFLAAPSHVSPAHSRNTDMGTIDLNTTTHTYGFTKIAADLVISGFAKHPLKKNTFVATIGNTGKTDAGKFVVALNLDGKNIPVARIGVASLAFGATKNITLTYTSPLPSTFKLPSSLNQRAVLTVDSGGTIAETNESNNRATILVTAP